MSHFVINTKAYLLHNASLSLGEGGVPSQLVVDELHFDLHLPWIIVN